ncbi:keratin, type II cytoskeletal 2 epidermal-like isoform X2 [Atheta coriaria]|uniref:keratin, type II cytoskeletal 2 epidermal-like isoform X2 n=1 Tax=Dalotia coriaria TaxID=877792 RepID=UPI0031F37C43
MASHISLTLLCLMGIYTIVTAYAGEYIPKSYYIIANGQRSDTVYLRSKRSVLHLLRKRRSSNIPGVPSPEQFFAQARDGFNPAAFQARIAGGNGGSGFGSGSGSGAYSFSSASASGGGGTQGGTGYSSGPSSNNNHHYSNVGSDSPRVFSRFGEEAGNNIHVSGSASGPHGAYSSSSATADGSGKVRYSVQSGKY